MSLVKAVPGHETYDWQVGIDRLKGLPVGVTYLIGPPCGAPALSTSAAASSR